VFGDALSGGHATADFVRCDLQLIAQASGRRQGKSADKISNVRAVATSPPVELSEQHRRDYIEFCTAVVNELRASIRHSSVSSAVVWMRSPSRNFWM
jgi:hypothetical protein